jgi:hypothetical protein
MPPDHSDPAHVRETRRKMNLLSLIAIWQLLSVLVVGYVLMWALAVTYMSYSEAEYFGVGMLWSIESLSYYAIELTLGLGYIVPALLGAIGLLRGAEWGRKLSLVHATVSLILFPIGTIPGALALRYLIRRDVREHFQAGRQAMSGPR